MVLCSSLLLQIGCTEPFEIKTIGFQNILVVESTITNEMKKQVVKLSRTTTLENPAVVIEKNAIVTITDSKGNVFGFSQENEKGHYFSDKEFQAETNIRYTLKISTQDGKNYISSAVILPPNVKMDQVYAELIIEDKKEGVQVFVDTHDTTGKAKYFRYEYEETYKVIAPYPSPYTAEIVNDNPDRETYEVALTPREIEEVCYSTINSIGVIQTATADKTQNRVFRFPIRFIGKSSSILRARYSILVKQYVQSLEAYTFYTIIEELGNVESLLSQGQPGYVTGNITSVTSSNEKVLGFFEASTVTSKRIYFNYTDFGLEKPPYFVDCDLLKLDYNDNTDQDGDLNERRALRINVKYYDYQVIYNYGTRIYHIVKEECSVCTSISSNLKPDFWED